MESNCVSRLKLYHIVGPDAAKFLQNQVTAEINNVTANHASFTATCDLKGRAIASFLLMWFEDGFLLAVDQSVSDELLAQYKKYAAFSKLSIEVRDDLAVAFVEQHLDGSSEPFAVNDRTIRHPNGKSAWQVVAGAEHTGVDTAAAEQAHNRANVATGIVFTSQSICAEFVPQIIGIETLGGISFRKGCYIGQEIVARMKYLGKAKKSLFRAKLADDCQLAVGDVLRDPSDRPVGTVVAVAPPHILAVLHRKHVENGLAIDLPALSELHDFNPSESIS